MLFPSFRRAIAGALGAAVIAATFSTGILPVPSAAAAVAEEAATPTPTATPDTATPDVATPEPTPEPSADQTPLPSADPTDASTPAPNSEPTPDPTDAGATEPDVSPQAAPETGATSNAGAHWPLVITEINGDIPGADNYEYLEIANTTDTAIDLEAVGIQIRYHTSQWNVGTVQPVITVEGETASAVIPAGGAAVFWMNYAPGDPRRSLTTDQFREFYGIGADAPIYRFGPQAGFANNGSRGFSLTDATGATLSRAWVPADDGVSSTPWNAQFAVPDLIGTTDSRLIAYDVTGATAQPTPGAVTAEQLTSALIKPTDPESDGPILQITEVAPDTANVSGSDAYEFIEIYNASDAPIGFGDYVLNYLTTDNALTGPKTNSSTLWPAGPGEPVIPAGGTIVLWIQNPAVLAAGLTADDFNHAFGTSLVLGSDLLTISSGGMANGGSRGLQLQTKTGHDVSRAYYFDDAQTTASTAIQYAWNPGAAAPLWAPADPAGTTQTLLNLSSPTPGAVSAEQVADSFVPHPEPGAAPVIVDLTGGSEVPDTGGIELGFDITDDVLVRRVTLTVTDDLGGSETRDLIFAAAGRYLYAIPEVDVYGKRWIEYTVTASDGAQTASLGPVRVTLDDSAVEPVRLNVADGQYVNGQTPVVATTDGDVQSLSLGIDGTAVTDGTASLEKAPVFAIEATATDAFFRNGIKLGDNVLKIFDEGYYDRIVTVDAEVPVDDVVHGQELTIGVYAGTKAWPQPDPNENNDDYTIMNPRLALPDGRVLRPTSCAGAGEGQEAMSRVCPTDASERINLSDANLVYFLATFTIPDDAFDSVSTLWDTTGVADGAHEITASVGQAASARAADADTVARTVIVDNTAPAITTSLTEGTRYRGPFTIDASATDAGSGFASLTASLDGEDIALPAETSSLELTPGDHVAVVTATDAVGNVSTSTVNFSTADELPRTVLVNPADGAVIEGDEVSLSAIPGSNLDDRLGVCFAEGYTYMPTDPSVGVVSGVTTDASSTERDGTPLSADDLEKLAGSDGVEVAETSETAMPYQLFTVAVPDGAETGSDVRVAWSGSANADAKVLLYVRTTKGTWEEVDRYVTTGAAATSFTLDAQVPVAGHADDGEITFLVQHSEGWAATDLSTRESDVVDYNAGATPRDQYDFTLAWQSDTQYYNSNEGNGAGTGGSDTYYQHQIDINEFLVAERENLNLQYVTHTGDIVDNHTEQHQWDNADAAYDILDRAGLPYGVLAGNHDVGHFDGDYGPYSTYFGADRFEDNPWYGGSYKDNRGHYDLVSVDGVDLLMLYMGWPDPNDTASNSSDIVWMNQVIAQYPERKVMINLHEYMLTTGGLGPFPQRIYDEVVAPNANVIAVGSGHYHDAYTRQDDFDDDGDGVADRTVYSMLFDYQGLPEGGLGYLRLLHFDNENGRIIVRTYSPSLDDFDSDEPSLNNPEGMQEFEIPYAAGGVSPIAKTLATDSFRADILTDDEIGCVQDIVSGESTSVNWTGLDEGEHGWYVRTTGPFGGVEYTEVRTFTSTAAEQVDPGEGSDGGTDGGSDSAGSDGAANGGSDGTGTGAGGSEAGEGGLATTGTSGSWLAGLGLGALAVLVVGAGLTLRGRRKA